MSVVQETAEYAKLKRKQDLEREQLIESNPTRAQIRRLAIKHSKQFIKLTDKWAHKEAKKA